MKPQLTERQIEVLRLICRGLVNKEICAQLSIALSSLKFHKKAIRERFGMPYANGVQLFIRAIENGYVSAPSVRA